MHVFFSYKQLLHNPPFEYLGDEKLPYPEVPQRARLVLDYLLKDVRFKIIEPIEKSDWGQFFLSIHDPIYLAIFKEASESIKSSRIYIYDSDKNLPHHNPEGLTILDFSFDMNTPFGAHTWESAYWSALSALNSAAMLRKGKIPAVFALTRPPGHHAGRYFFGGYCYINNAALAAEYLSILGKVAILDFDFHHGNGTEDIFYQRRRVLYVSIHCRPPYAYPYFTGITSAQGSGQGKGFNLNIPIEPACGSKVYRQALNKALRAIRDFSPRYLVISAGFDIFQGDPEDNFDLPLDFSAELGYVIGKLKLPTLTVLEGGYNLDTLPELVYSFLYSLGEALR